MVKRKRTLVILSCILLVLMFSMPVFMVGCYGEDVGTLTTDAENYVDDKGIVTYTKNEKWKITITYTPVYLEVMNGDKIEVYGTDRNSEARQAQTKKKYPGKKIDVQKDEGLTLKDYDDLINAHFSISGFNQ